MSKRRKVAEPQTKLHRFAIWWSDTSPTGKITMVTALVTGITASILGLSHARPIIEAYWYVAQYELREVADKQAVATDRQTLFQLQEYLRRAKADPGAARSPTAQEYIKNLERQIQETESRISRTK